MAYLTGAQLKTELDNVAYQKSLLDTAIGTTATAATILHAMQALTDRVNGYDEEIQRDLANVASEIKNAMEAFKLSLDHKLLRQIDSHLREETGLGIDDYWTQENYPTYRIASQVAELCRAVGIWLSPINCFPPVTIMGTEVASGSGAGTFTAGTDIDANKYGPADCELEVLVAATTVSVVVTVTGLDENGAEVTGTAEFSTAAVGDKVDVTPDQAGKQFQSITTMTFTGGASTDSWQAQSKVDRAVAA